MKKLKKWREKFYSEQMVSSILMFLNDLTISWKVAVKMNEA